MKQSVIIILLVFIILKAQAQDYYINFSGRGDTNVVTTVKIDNLSSGASVILNAEDVLHLTGGNSIPKSFINSRTMKLVPNPMTDHSELTYVTPEKGVADIRILDLSGSIVCQKSTLLSSGVHSFFISGISKGIYIVKVTGNNYFYSTELISQANVPGESSIEYLKTVQVHSDSWLKNETSVINMPYSDGEQLLYKSISGKYSTIVPDVPTSNKTVTFNFVACTDADQNNYPTVKVGDQTWMAQNLNVGARIDGNHSQTNNNIIEKYCYNDDVNNCNIYGGLYSCDEMMKYTTTPGGQGICPKGWHIPTDDEWTELTTYLGGDSIAGGKMKETGLLHWSNSKTRATNKSGFSALPGGAKLWAEPSTYMFYNIGQLGLWWSSTESRFSNFIGRFNHYDSGEVYMIDHSICDEALSVRCIRE